MGTRFQADDKLTKNTRINVITALCMLMSHLAFTQDSYLMDSLRQRLTHAKPQEKAMLWARMAQAYSGKQTELSRQYADSAIQLAQKIGYPEAESKALTYLGYFYYDVGALDSALQVVEEGISIDRELGNSKGIANQMNALAHIYVSKGDYQQALTAYQEALQIEREIGNANGISAKLNNLGTLYQQLDMYPEAIDYYLQALEVNEANAFASKAAINHKNIGFIYMLRSDYDKAMPHLRRALTIVRERDDRHLMAGIYDHMGLLKFNLGNTDSARFFLEQSLRLCRELNSHGQLSVTLANLSDVYRETGDIEKARSLVEESVKIQKQIKDSLNLSIGHQKLAELYLDEENFFEALRYARVAESIAQERKHRKALHEAKGLLSEIYHRLGNDSLSYQLLREQMLIKDTLYREEKEKRFEELEIRYQAEKKEREIERLNQEKLLQEARLEQAHLLRNFSIGTLLLLSLVGFLFIRQRKIRQEVREQALAHQLKVEQLEANRLQEVDQVKSRFFANIAHEFRTPLTLISGPVSQMMEQPNSRQDHEHLRLVQRNADRLLNLINQILDLSKLESGLLLVHEEPLEAVTFSRGLTFSFQSLAEQRHIQLAFESSVEEHWVQADADKLEKILTNLLSNAFKFTPEGGEVRLHLGIIEKPDPHILIRVVDTGKGIPAEQQALIFERFQQAAIADQPMGSGIGLALTKELVELMGGDISLHSEQGQGSTFEVCLPLQPAQHTGHSAERPTTISEEKPSIITQEVPEEEKLPDEMVLVIEDNPDVRQYIRQSLSPHYRVMVAENGRVGVKMAQQEIPDLIVSDVMMPGMDGYQACRLIKEDEKTSHIPVILLTAKAGMEHKLEGLETGADDYLAKPFHTKELLVRIRNLIRLRQNLRQKYLRQVLEDKTELPASREDAFLKKLREVVEAHLDEEGFSIEALSREVGMSRTQVHRKLKALTSQSASQFIRSIRLRHARQMLRTTNMNVSEVAYQVGFNSLSYFSTCFTEAYGTAPSDVRRPGVNA